MQPLGFERSVIRAKAHLLRLKHANLYWRGSQLNKNRVSLGSKLAYGFGSVAFGVKNNGFDYFLLFFYSQVMGVSALVNAALAIALVFDAISDPLIGFSDNTRTRWGRRHPYMYGAAVPVTLCYFLLWNPPGQLSGDELFPPCRGIRSGTP